MTWVEVSGKTLEEAKEIAAGELGVSVDQLEVEVVDEGSKGFLGIGQPKVTIRATTSDGQSVSVGEEDHANASSKAAQIISMLEQVLRAMEFDAKPVLVSETDEDISVDIVGKSEDLGRLIGRHGQTLDALQYLLALAVNKQDQNKIRVTLDTEGYRERHRQMLEAKAHEYARQVKEMGSEAVLEPQSPRDRRLVHMALADDPDVCTYSEGEGEARHVVISPKK